MLCPLLYASTLFEPYQENDFDMCRLWPFHRRLLYFSSNKNLFNNTSLKLSIIIPKNSFMQTSLSKNLIWNARFLIHHVTRHLNSMNQLKKIVNKLNYICIFIDPNWWYFGRGTPQITSPLTTFCFLIIIQIDSLWLIVRSFKDNRKHVWCLMFDVWCLMFETTFKIRESPNFC